MDIKYIATFHTHFGAQSFDRRLKKESQECKLMPVPRQLSASCGICVAFEADCTSSIEKNIPEDMEGLYMIDGKSFKTLIEIDD